MLYILNIHDLKSLMLVRWKNLRNKTSVQSLSRVRLFATPCYFCPKKEIIIFLCIVVVSDKAVAPHSNTLAWKIPWMEEPGRLQSMGSRLSDFTFTFHFHALEKEMATHCSVLAWRIPGTGEPGGLPSLGSYRVRHLAAAVSELIKLSLD